MPIFALILINLIFMASAFYLSRRLVPKKWPIAPKWLAWLGIAALSASFPLYFLTRVSRDDLSSLLANFITFGMGLFSLLLTFTVIRDVLWLAFKKSPWQKNLSPQRREFLRNSSRLGVVGLTSAVFGKAVRNAMAEPTIHRVSVTIPNLPSELEGFSIVQISDVHVGQLKNQTEYVRQIVQAVNSCNADLVAVTGDVVDGSVAQLAPHVAPLAGLHGKFGTFFVTGNHEYYSGAPEWIEHFKTLGWQVLENEHRTLKAAGHNIVVAGVHDYKAGTHIAEHACNPAAALTNAPANAALTLLLAHHPSTAELTDGLKIDLQLSGHTHAGQYFPATWIVQWVHKYAQGLNRHNDSQVYVNSGTGYWGPALRTTDIVGEVTLLTLRRDG
ncbi:MAG: metallophosphoesterase [Formosimonas sp.]